MLISSKCEYCHCFGAHLLIDNLKSNILTLTPKKNVFWFQGDFKLWYYNITVCSLIEHKRLLSKTWKNLAPKLLTVGMWFFRQKKTLCCHAYWTVLLLIHLSVLDTWIIVQLKPWTPKKWKTRNFVCLLPPDYVLTQSTYNKKIK